MSSIKRPEMSDAEYEARQELRTAIENREKHTELLAQAEKAVGAARKRAFEIEEQLDGIERERQRPAAERDGSSAALIGALLEGQMIAVLEPGENEQKLRDEASALRDAAARLLKYEIPTRRSSCGIAETRVRTSARAVVASTAIEDLIVGLGELQAAVLKRRVALNAILSSGVKGELAKRAESLLFERLDVGSQPFGDNPEHARWTEALEGLSRNPDHPLPNVEELR